MGHALSGTLRWLLPMAPALAILLLFFAGPVIWTFYIAFTNMALTGPGARSVSLVGVQNFESMFRDPTFFQSVILTILFAVASAIVGQAGLGMLLALLMRGRNGIFRGVIGAIVVGAWVVPEIVAAFIWFAFLSKDGTLNAILGTVGLPTNNWLFVAPMLSVIVANIWRGTAFSMLVFSAAIGSVPPDVIEAARTDGASGPQRLWHVTLPLMKGSILTDLILITLQTLSVFALIFVMTGGGPGTASQTLPIYMYQQAFKFYQLGYGAAVALILLLIGALASLIYLRILEVEA
jgi:multiple sugar transport system permease protein